MYLWDIWIIPLLFVMGLIVFICIVAESKIRRSGKILESREDVAEAIQEKPITLNPVVVAGIIAAIFMFIIIYYYAATAT